LPTLTICGNHNRKGASKTSQDGLVTVLRRMFPTLCSRDYRTGKPRRHTRGGKDLAAELTAGAGGPLNPSWCEAFMTWPIGATELPPSATAGCRRKRRSPGGCSEGSATASEPAPVGGGEPAKVPLVYTINPLQ